MIGSVLLCASVLVLSDPGQGKQISKPAAQQTADQAKAEVKKPEAADKDKKDTRQADRSQPKPGAVEPEEKEVDGVKLLVIEANVVDQTNQERKRYGLPSLVVDKDLMGSAREHTSWMARFRIFRHARRMVAENIAMGQTCSSEAVRGWMTSPGHRANILNPSHRRIGVAAYQAEDGTVFWCQQFQP